MVRPNFIPRTLRGVGGVRLFNIPGVIYPKEVLVPKAGMNRKSGLPYREVPGWGVTSREAANLLGCTPAAARTWLHRRKVPYRLVGSQGESLRLFWRKDRVISLAEQRLPIVQTCPPSYISASEALRILKVGRSSLHRYQERGQLSVVYLRIATARGLRKCCCFRRAEVEALAKHLSRIRCQESVLSRIRCKLVDASPPADPPSLHPPHKARSKKKM